MFLDEEIGKHHHRRFNLTQKENGMNIYDRLKTAIATGSADEEAERLANLAPDMEKVLKRILDDCADPQTHAAMNHKLWIEEVLK